MAFSSVALKLPALVGTRQLAETLTAMLPDDLSSTELTIDCSEVISAAQGFTDELCRQTLGIRNARALLLQLPPDRMVSHALRSAQLRVLPGLSIVARS